MGEKSQRQLFSLSSLFLSSLMSRISLTEESKISAYMLGRFKTKDQKLDSGMSFTGTLQWGKTSSSTSSHFLSGIKPIVSTPLLPFLTYEGQSKDLLRRYHIYHSVSHISSCWNRIKRWRNLNFRLHLQFTLQIKGQ